MKFIIVTTTIDNKKDAETLSKKIVESRLGACVQISEIKSFYKWKDKLESPKEFKLEIKTISQNYKKLQEFIIKNNKYDTPEIIVTNMKAGYSKYLNWMKENCI